MSKPNPPPWSVFRDDSGVDRICSLLPRASQPTMWRPSSAVIPLIPESDWEEGWGLEESRWPAVVKDQNGLSYCHSYAGAGIVEITDLLSDSRKTRRCSGTGLGTLVTGGVNRGASLDEVLRTALETGVPLEEDVPEYQRNTSRWVSGWEKRCVRLKEVYDHGYNDIFERVTSAMAPRCGRWLSIIGCSRPWGPHAVIPVRLIRIGNEWGWDILNSWGTNQGDKGYNQVRRSQITGLDGYGGWLVRVTA